MNRTTILFPVLLAFVAGGLLGGRLLPAEAQRPDPAPAASCEDELAKRDLALRRARRLATQSEARARAARDAAEASAAQMQIRVRELERLLERERERVKRLTEQLGPTYIEDINFR